MRHQLVTAALGGMLIALTACGSEHGGGDPVAGYDDTNGDDPLASLGEPVISESILEIAGANPDLSMLVAALKSAELDETLNGEGPFTVFAPTNIGFEKDGASTTAPVATVAGTEEVARPKKDMTAILGYHVVAGKLLADDLAKQVADNGGSIKLKTLSGAELTVQDQSGSLVMVDGTGASTAFTLTDVEASNGVVHTIDTVLKIKK